MWSGGKETGEEGEAVLLFAPSLSNTSCDANPSTSFIGGHPIYFPKDELVTSHCGEVPESDAGTNAPSLPPRFGNPNCKLCQQRMHLLSQINAPVECQNLDRALYVFGCNRAKCWEKASGGRETSATNDRECQFIIGGSGVVHCIRSQQTGIISSYSPAAVSSQTKESDATRESVTRSGDLGGWGDDIQDDYADSWGDGDNGNDGVADDDWGATTGDGVESMDDVEAMLKACEMNEDKKLSTSTSQPQGKKKNTRKQEKSGKKKVSPQSNDGDFDWFELEMYEEPYAATGGEGEETDDDDDDGAVGATGTSDAKIQKLLSRYLEEEEDQELISALVGSGNGVSGGGGGSSSSSGEKFERLPPDERAFLAFTDRIKRSPQQVVRYAYGGVPLWSVPIPTRQQQKEKSGKESQGHRSQSNGDKFPTVPPCVCGSKRTFELELLPSILFALDVDRCAHATQGTKDGEATALVTGATPAANDAEERMRNEFGNGGMDWGALAIYSCPASCDMSREEYVVVQKSVDGAPEKREFNLLQDDSSSKTSQKSGINDK